MLSKTGLHAVRALVALARLPEGAYAGAGTVAKEIGAPRNYLGKLLQNLITEGLVASQKGSGGGFRLVRAPGDVSLYDIVEPIEHLSRWKECILGWPECSEHNPCSVHDRWKVVRSAYLALLQKTTLADLVENGEPKFLGW